MIERIEEFAGLLRGNGARVSTAEVLDATRALACVGVDDLVTARCALRAALVKREADVAVFDELFDLYFLRGHGAVRGGAPLVELLAAEGLSAELVERIIARLADEVHRLGAVARMGLGLRAADVGAIARSTGVVGELSRMASPLQVGFYSHRLAEAADLRGAEAQIDAVLARLVGAAGLSEAELALVRAVVARNLKALRQAMRSYVQAEFQLRHRDFYQQVAARSLVDKPLAQLSDREVEALRGQVVRLARILRAKVQLHHQPKRRGRLDVRRTLRRALATGGIPFELVRRERRRKKPRLVVLCDISDSVRSVSRFMLQFVYTLQELFDRVHTFAFVAELGELTDLFRQHELDRAVELAYSGAVINVFANSNYGRVLAQFTARHLDKVTPRTTVLVIGDGRNNYHASNHALLGDIRRRAKRVIWLNPEAPAAWGFGDSAMREYETHCDAVAVASNLDSLRRIIDELVVT
jgi:hypothetical protein